MQYIDVSVHCAGDNAIRKEEWPGSSLKNNQEEEERMKKLQNDQELRRKQEEEMAQIYPAKYSYVNGGNELGGGGAINNEAKVFDTYGAKLNSPLIRAHIDYSNHLQIEKEMQSVSKATPRLRQKWQNEESQATSMSPVSSRKNSYDHLLADKQVTSSSQDEKFVLEEQLKQLQLEAQLAR